MAVERCQRTLDQLRLATLPVILCGLARGPMTLVPRGEVALLQSRPGEAHTAGNIGQ